MYQEENAAGEAPPSVAGCDTGILPNDGATTLEYALAYAALGWPVLPLWWSDGEAGEVCGCPNGAACKSKPGKHPLGAEVPHGYKDATTDPAQIEAWWTKWPKANIGIATGAASGIVVVDVDPRNGGDDTIRALEAQYGKLKSKIVTKTGGGGWHVIYQYDGRKLPKTLGAGIDLKGDGGYIVAPPSVTRGRYSFTKFDPFTGELPEMQQLLEWIGEPSAFMGLGVAGAAGGKVSARGVPLNQALVWDGDPRGAIEDIESALAEIPNEVMEWEFWNTIGLAIYAATGGSAEGLRAWLGWSAKNKNINPKTGMPVFDEAYTVERWDHFHKSPPTRTGARALFELAKQHNPKWVKPSDHARGTEGRAAPLKAIQGRFTLSTVGGKLGVIDSVKLGVSGGSEGRAAPLNILNRADGAVIMARAVKEIAPGEDGGAVFKAWLHDPQTRVIDSITFTPEGGGARYIESMGSPDHLATPWCMALDPGIVAGCSVRGKRGALRLPVEVHSPRAPATGGEAGNYHRADGRARHGQGYARQNFTENLDGDVFPNPPN